MLYLYLYHAINIIVPVLTYSYIIKIVGVEKFGVIAFGNAIAGVFQLIYDYGFNYIGTRETSIQRNNCHELSKLFSSIIIGRFFILLPLVLVYFLLSSWIDKIEPRKFFYFSFIISTFMYSVIPFWFLQGLENFKIMFIANLIAKGLFMLGIIIFITGPTTYFIYPYIFLISSGISLFLSLMYIYFRYRLSFVLNGYTLRKIMVDGFSLFIHRGSVSSYTHLPQVFLGIYSTDYYLGIYSFCEKISRSAVMLISPVKDYFFPQLSKLFSIDRKKFKSRVYEIYLKYLFPASIIILLLFLYLNKPIIGMIVIDESDLNILSSMMSIFAFLPFGIVLGDHFGLNGLVVSGQYRIIRNLVLLYSFVHIFSMVAIVNLFDPFRILILFSFLIVLTENAIGFSCYYLFKKLL